MSQTEAPAEPKQKKPVETQADSAGEKPSKAETNGKQQPAEDSEEFKKAVAEAVKNQFNVTDAWQPKHVVKFVIDCPSGQKVLVKHLDTKDLMRANLLEDMDRFTKMLFPTALDAQGNPVDATGESVDQGIWGILRDAERRCRFFDTTNRLMVVAAQKPHLVNDGVALRTNEAGDKEEVFGYEVESIDEQVKLFGKPVPPLQEGEAYCGAVDFADRMTFFQELNKPLEMIEPFREESYAVLASMEPSKSPRVQAEQPV